MSPVFNSRMKESNLFGLHLQCFLVFESDQREFHSSRAITQTREVSPHCEEDVDARKSLWRRTRAIQWPETRGYWNLRLLLLTARCVLQLWSRYAKRQHKFITTYPKCNRFTAYFNVSECRFSKESEIRPGSTVCALVRTFSTARLASDFGHRYAFCKPYILINLGNVPVKRNAATIQREADIGNLNKQHMNGKSLLCNFAKQWHFIMEYKFYMYMYTISVNSRMVHVCPPCMSAN